MDKPIVTIGPEEIAYQGKIIEVYKQKVQTGDKEQVFEYARRSPGSRLIIVTPTNGIILTKEYRQEADGYDYRLPGGKVFNTLAEYNQYLVNGNSIIEKAQQGAIIEAREEVGIAVEEINYFATSKAGATIIWDLLYFVVSKYSILPEGQHLEHGEDIAIITVSRDEAKAMCLDGRIQEDRSAAVLLRYLHK